MDEKTCPSCHHPKAHHSPLVGCLADDADPCECERSFPNANATPQKAEAEKVEAMGRAASGSDADWVGKVVDAVRHLNDTLATWTPDDVWERLEDQGVPAPREPRALGPILKAMANGPAATIEWLAYDKSRRRHKAPVSVYRARTA
jgi:hypothetical protein